MADAGDDDGFGVLAIRHEDGRMEVLVLGDLDLDTVPQLLATVHAELQVDHAADVDVVLNAVTFADSTGLLALAELRDTVRSRGGRFRLVAPSAPVRFVLEVAGLAAFFEID